ncbi:hypothetical protein ACLI4R_15265 [Natrialbaceae archaeon A-chndr2]
MFEITPEIAMAVLEGATLENFTDSGAAALAVGLAALATGYAQRGIGSAAVGAMAEDDSTFGKGLILTVLPETLVILALVVVFLV